MSRTRKAKYTVAPGEVCYHSVEGRRYREGEEINLDHLDAATIARLIAQGVVVGEALALPVEAAGVPHQAARFLWAAGVKAPEDLLRLPAEGIAGLAMAEVDTARAWRAKAEQLLAPPAPAKGRAKEGKE